MSTRNAELIRGPRSYWGLEHADRASSTGVSEPPIRLKVIQSGAVMDAQLFTGAVEVIRCHAVVVNGDEWKKVICRRNVCQDALKEFRVGVPISVIDPGLRNSFYVLPDGKESNPIIAKGTCRLVEKCTDATEACGNCCNNPNKIKK